MCNVGHNNGFHVVDKKRSQSLSGWAVAFDFSERCGGATTHSQIFGVAVNRISKLVAFEHDQGKQGWLQKPTIDCACLCWLS
ncbi:hypothetical protein H6G80_29470 [Nostoc sp. FACHB-87]|uniref:hypothetical protein n=1 Tax=Nostocaceae TaxID=1162 RepID=UPI0016836D33|nr:MULTISPECIES: hypothetical protein [Nostocaceae]MBD2458183.1 hypothetical protein [Nostoc sp. FACHB-87]MBD2479398.1 hypothetical protein [Anabaena sp. FACHB-83]